MKYCTVVIEDARRVCCRACTRPPCFSLHVTHNGFVDQICLTVVIVQVVAAIVKVVVRTCMDMQGSNTKYARQVLSDDEEARVDNLEVNLRRAVRQV